MKSKYYSLLILLIFTLGAFGQNQINTIKTEIDKDHFTYDVVDDVNNKTYLFLVSSKSVEAIQLDPSFQVLSQFIVNRPETKFKQLLGHSTALNSLTLYWSTNNSDKIISQHFDFKEKEASLGAIESIDKEKVVTSFPFDNKFYIATVTKNSNLFKLYELDGKNALKPYFFPFEKYRFYNKKYAPISLDAMFKEYFIEENEYELQNISSDIPTALPYIAKKRKYYIKKDNLIISFDNNSSFTQLIKINLRTKKTEHFAINQSFLNTNHSEKTDSNSFLFDDKIAQIKTNKEITTIQISNFIDKSPILKKEIRRDQTIDFLTTPILEYSNGKLEKSKEIIKTNQFLNRLNRAQNVGVSVTPTKSGYIFTFGGSSILQNSDTSIATSIGGGVGGALGGLVGGLMAAAITSSESPKKNFLNAYRNKKVIIASTSFDSNFNLNNEETLEDITEKARTYLFDLSIKKPMGLNFFKTQSKYLLTYTDRDSGLLYITEIN